MQSTEIETNEKVHYIFLKIYLLFTKNIDLGYSLEPPRRSGSNEYQQSMFWSKNKCTYTSAYPSIKVRYKGVYITWTCVLVIKVASYLEPVVQSIVSLTISLRHKFVKQISAKVTNTLLFFVEKNVRILLTFFQQKITVYL